MINMFFNILRKIDEISENYKTDSKYKKDLF